MHAGGRGKGRFKDSGKDFGGVKYLTKREAVAETMFKFPLVTKQTDAAGQKVSTVLVQEAADIAKEIYVGMVLDRRLGVPVVIVYNFDTCVFRVNVGCIDFRKDPL